MHYLRHGALGSVVPLAVIAHFFCFRVLKLTITPPPHPPCCRSRYTLISDLRFLLPP